MAALYLSVTNHSERAQYPPMNWVDFALGVLFLALVPLLLAAFGGHVAADTYTDPRKRRNTKLTFWGLFVLGLLLAIQYQYRVMVTDDARQEKIDQGTAEARAANQRLADQMTTMLARLDDAINRAPPGQQKQQLVTLRKQIFDDWQRVIILQTLSQFPRQKVLILSGVGDKALARANEFRDMFVKSKWIVEGPRTAPLNQMVLDVQISADNRSPTRPEVTAIFSALKSAGVKCRDSVILDPKVPQDLMVLWVGAETPPGFPEHVPLSLPPDWKY